jgi:hypothetical protein
VDHPVIPGKCSPRRLRIQLTDDEEEMQVIGFQTVQHSVIILYKRNVLNEYADYLPTLPFVSDVIDKINAAKPAEAVTAINKCTQLFNLIKDDLTQIEVEWYSGIIEFLKMGIRASGSDVFSPGDKCWRSDMGVESPKTSWTGRCG